MSSTGKPSTKRRKLLPISPNSSIPSTTPLPEHYLRCFDKQNPIAVVVTPLRKQQGLILTRNLREAGAYVIDPEYPLDVRTSLAPDAELLIVTDAKANAEKRLAISPANFTSVRYVSTKWASKVLSTQSVLSPEAFELTDPPEHDAHPSSEPMPSAHPTPPSSRRFLPVWCTRSMYSMDDISEKKEILRRLPSFLCERATLTQALYPPPNDVLCKLLDQIAKKRILEQAGGSAASADIRARAYRLASSALKCVPFKLKTQQDAQSLRSFGPRVLAAVNEFLATGTLHEANMLALEPRLQTLSAFQDMYGVGATTARELYDIRAIHSVASLRDRVRKKPEDFSKPLVKYLHFYDELERMSPSNARGFCRRVEQVANSTKQGNLRLRFVLCGGFRRGEQSGHDVDLVYCRRASHGHDTSSVLGELVEQLRLEGLIVAVLGYSANKAGWEEKRYSHEPRRSAYRFAHDILHGLGRWEGTVFRVDLVGVREATEFPFAMLAWSGSTAFQRDLRLACEKKRNWIFNQHGLFDRVEGHRVDLRPPPMTEMDIFDAIGLVYRAPFERSC